jgi:hypothetical protein
MGRKKKLQNGVAPPPVPVIPGNVPRVSKLLALAHRFERSLDDEHARDFADLARLGRVTRARITQIMNLLLLAPDIQEDILFLPRTLQGRDPITERHLRPIVAQAAWPAQRRLWQKLRTQDKNAV